MILKGCMVWNSKTRCFVFSYMFCTVFWELKILW